MIWCKVYSDWTHIIKETIPVRIIDKICNDNCVNCIYGGKKNIEDKNN